MKAKELKRLSRSDLLEMLLDLSLENDRLNKELKELREAMAQRSIAVAESGSLAEAALKLNGIFEAAQAACDQYTENIRSRSDNMAETCREMEAQARAKCDEMLADAEKRCEEMVSNARQQAGQLVEEGRSQRESWAGEHQWLVDILDGGEPSEKE